MASRLSDSYAQYLNDADSGINLEAAWKNHEYRMGDDPMAKAERTPNIRQETQERLKSIRLQFANHVPLQRPVEDTRTRLGQFIDKVKDVVRERRNAREDAQIVGNTKQMISEGAAMLKDKLEVREERSSFVVEPRQMELGLSSRGELSQAQMQDLARQTLASDIQDRIWNDPKAVSDHAEWMTKAVAENDRLDRINDPVDDKLVYYDSGRQNDHDPKVAEISDMTNAQFERWADVALGPKAETASQDLARQNAAWEKMSSNTDGHNPQREQAQAQTVGMRV